MGRVFLSYAREDRRCAEMLAATLERAGHSVWWDSQIDGGEEFSAEIEAALEEANVVLVAWSRNAVKSRWVRDEAGVGGDTGRLVPVSVDGTPPPMGFRQFHTLDLKGWKGGPADNRTTELLRSIDRRLGHEHDTSEPTQSRSGFTPKLSRTGVMIIAATAILLVLAAANFVLGRSQSSSTRPTIALLPFTTSSADPALRSMAVQARDSTAHSLTDTGVLVTLVDTAPANESNANYLLSGELGGTPEKANATIRLEDARHRTTIWSSKFDAEGADVANLADRIGAQVAGTLGWALPLRMLGPGQPSDPELTAQLMRQLDLKADPLESYQIAKAAAAKWPKSAAAQLSLAFNTAFVLGQIPREQRPAAVTLAREAAARAESGLSDFGDAYIPLCLLQPETRYSDCEDRMRAAIRKDPDAPFVDSFLARIMGDVGRIGEAFELARLSYAHDRYMPEKIALMIRMLEVTGDDKGAEDLFHKAYAWWPDSGLVQSRLWGYILRGDFGAIVQFRNSMGSNFPPDYAALADVADAAISKSLPSLKQTCSRTNLHWLVPGECMLAFAKVGDFDTAYAIADQIYPNRIGRGPEDEERLWLNDPDSMPTIFIASEAAAPIRTDPRYIQLAERTGLLRYWRNRRLPDFCTKQHEPICSKFRAAG